MEASTKDSDTTQEAEFLRNVIEDYEEQGVPRGEIGLRLISGGIALYLNAYGREKTAKFLCDLAVGVERSGAHITHQKN